MLLSARKTYLRRVCVTRGSPEGSYSAERRTKIDGERRDVFATIQRSCARALQDRLLNLRYVENERNIN